ncbi:nuclease-related domain-containing protein [Phycicoccus sp.]|uniref:nuclease-related domain-containing protein n=1 Tax=Phycicoccus sp. TaxID=1902410 RepID=UPI002C43F1C4|nr:nuclease-related domain-containing protein [Phycicoccus sp.]HMM94397.1 nuclease-related domain-containing protein [Phycicoccus sp.]
MKEDVLEQVVEDYLQLKGYFTQHNLRFKPNPSHPDFVGRDDAVSSDVDVVGYNPTLIGAERVWVVSCKAWQSGFDARAKLLEMRGEKKNPKRETWKHFRELWNPKWSDSFRSKVEQVTGQRAFVYSLAVTKLNGSWSREEAIEHWSADPVIAGHLEGCSFSFLTMRQMWSELQLQLTTTPAPSDIGRLAQLLKAAEIEA